MMKSNPEKKQDKQTETDVLISFFQDVYNKMAVLQKAICVLTKSLNENGVLTPEQVKETQLTLLDALSNEDERIKAKYDVIAAHAGIKKVERDPEVEK